MSLWLESLGERLCNCKKFPEEKARCILAYLSMDVPRYWWKEALEENSLPSKSQINIIRDLRTELLNMPGQNEQIDYGLVMAMAFMDDESQDVGHDRFDNVRSRYSLDDYFITARKVLAERPDLVRLGSLIDREANRFEECDS
jgi:hypothetical protein